MGEINFSNPLRYFKFSNPLRYFKRRYLPPEPIAFLYLLATILGSQILQQYSYYKICLLIAGSQCNYTLHNRETNTCISTPSVTQIQSHASYLSIWLNLMSCAPTIIATLVIGPLTDRLGRKIAFYLPIFGSLIAHTFNLLHDIFNLHPYYLLIGLFFLGLGGNYPTVIMGCNAHVTDLSTQRYRTLRLSILQTSLLFGSALSNFVGGILLEAIGFKYEFIVILSLFAITLIYVIILPESLPNLNGRISTTENNPTSYNEGFSKDKLKIVLKNMFKPFLLFYYNNSRLHFIFLLIVFGSSLSDIYGNVDLFSLYALGPPMCWLPHYIGWYFAFIYLANMLGIYFVLPILLKFNISDYMIIIIAAFDTIIMYCLVGSFQSYIMLLLVVPCASCLTFLAGPSIKSAFTKLVDKANIGSLFSLLSVLTTITQLVSSAVYNSIYPTLRVYSPGLAFYVIAGTAIIPISISTILYIHEIISKRRLNQFNAKKKEEFINESHDNYLSEEDAPLI